MFVPVLQKHPRSHAHFRTPAPTVYSDLSHRRNAAGSCDGCDTEVASCMERAARSISGAAVWAIMLWVKWYRSSDSIVRLRPARAVRCRLINQEHS